MMVMMRVQKSPLKSFKIAYVAVKPLYLTICGYELAVAKSYGLKILVKLGGRQEIFKNTLEERPPEKSCST